MHEKSPLTHPVTPPFHPTPPHSTPPHPLSQTFAKMSMNERGPIRPSPLSNEVVRHLNPLDRAANLGYQQSRMLDPVFKTAFQQWMKVQYYEASGSSKIVDDLIGVLPTSEDSQVTYPTHPLSTFSLHPTNTSKCTLSIHSSPSSLSPPPPPINLTLHQLPPYHPTPPACESDHGMRHW